jgi:hypothetical protein
MILLMVSLPRSAFLQPTVKPKAAVGMDRWPLPGLNFVQVGASSHSRTSE